MCGAERRTHVKGAGAGLLGWTHTFIKTKVSGARTSHGDGDGGHRASHGDGDVDMSCVTLSHVLSRGSHFYWHIRSSKILLLIHHKKLKRIIDVPLCFC